MKNLLFLSLIVAFSVSSWAEVRRKSKASEVNYHRDLSLKDYAESCREDGKSDKNYLESKLAEMHPDVSKCDEYNHNNQMISCQCVHAAQMTFGSDARFYRNCTAGNQNVRSLSRVRRPCLSQNYIALMATTYNDVMSCFKIPPKKLFAKFAVESGLHVNPVREAWEYLDPQTGKWRVATEKLSYYKGQNIKTRLTIKGDSGTGQLTQVAIQDVNNNFEWLKSKMQGGSVCGSYKQEILNKPMSPRSALSCERMMLPQNPAKNILYSAMLYTLNKEKYVADAFDNLRRGSRIRTKLAMLSPSQVDNLKEIATQLGYNRGAGTAAGLVLDYLDDHNVRQDNFERHFFAKGGFTQQHGRYLAAIQERGKILNERVGGMRDSRACSLPQLL